MAIRLVLHSLLSLKTWELHLGVWERNGLCGTSRAFKLSDSTRAKNPQQPASIFEPFDWKVLTSFRQQNRIPNRTLFSTPKARAIFTDQKVWISRRFRTFFAPLNSSKSTIFVYKGNRDFRCWTRWSWIVRLLMICFGKQNAFKLETVKAGAGSTLNQRRTNSLLSLSEFDFSFQWKVVEFTTTQASHSVNLWSLESSLITVWLVISDYSLIKWTSSISKMSKGDRRPAAQSTGLMSGQNKTVIALAIALGCFAVLFPKIFYPMYQGSTSKSADSNGNLIHFIDRFFLVIFCSPLTIV